MRACVFFLYHMISLVSLPSGVYLAYTLFHGKVSHGGYLDPLILWEESSATDKEYKIKMFLL